MTKIKNFLFCLILLIPFSSFSQIPECPNPQKLVNDYANILSKDEKAALERKLVHFSDTTSNQITIVIIDDLAGYEIKDFGTRLGAKWKIGQKDLNNGILIIVKPTDKNGNKEAAISTGYGLEGAIPDLMTKRIREEFMNPYFKENKFYQGLDAATSEIMKLASKEINSKKYAKKKRKGTNPIWGILPIIFIIIILRIFKTRSYASDNGTSFWTALFLMSTLNSGRGSWGDFNGGGGDFGGGDDSFGGFGGGDFGGGGSSGGW